MTSHSNPTPLFFGLDGKSPPILMWWSLASYSVTNGGILQPFKLTHDQMLESVFWKCEFVYSPRNQMPSVLKESMYAQ